MSLKAFHILFIGLAVLLALGCAWWGFANEVTPAFGASAIVVAVALVFTVFRSSAKRGTS